MIAAIYVAVTFAFYFLSYDAVQFRISEVMILLAFIDPLYAPGLVLGCFIANLLGPYGIIDAVFGSISSIVVLFMIIRTRKRMGNNLKSLTIASLWASALSFIIAYEITFIFGAPESFWFWTLMVAVGEFVVVSLVGVPIFSQIIKKPSVIKQLEISKGYDTE